MRFLLTLLLGTLLVLPSCDGRKDTGLPSSGEGSVLVSDRLSNQRVNSFAEDGDGHIWIATGRGLDKYTVNDYHQYFCADDTLGLPDNRSIPSSTARRAGSGPEPRTASPSRRRKAASAASPSWATA